MSDRKQIRVTIPANKVKAFNDAKQYAENAAMIRLTDTQFASRLLEKTISQSTIRFSYPCGEIDPMFKETLSRFMQITHDQFGEEIHWTDISNKADVLLSEILGVEIDPSSDLSGFIAAICKSSYMAGKLSATKKGGS